MTILQVGSAEKKMLMETENGDETSTLKIQETDIHQCFAHFSETWFLTPFRPRWILKKLFCCFLTCEWLESGVHALGLELM